MATYLIYEFFFLFLCDGDHLLAPLQMREKLHDPVSRCTQLRTHQEELTLNLIILHLDTVTLTEELLQLLQGSKVKHNNCPRDMQNKTLYFVHGVY